MTPARPFPGERTETIAIPRSPVARFGTSHRGAIPIVTFPMKRTIKRRLPALTHRRSEAIKYVADKVRILADARRGRGGLFATERAEAAQFRAFVQWADALGAFQAAKGKR